MKESLRQQPVSERFGRAASLFGLFVAMFTLAGFYLHLHHRDVMVDLGHIADVACTHCDNNGCMCFLPPAMRGHAEILPLLVFAMTVAIAYDEDLALLLCGRGCSCSCCWLGSGTSRLHNINSGGGSNNFFGWVASGVGAN